MPPAVMVASPHTATGAAPPARSVTKAAPTVRAQAPPAPLSREDRTALFGIDCADSLEWRNWSPGGEYHKTLLVKNLSTKSVRLRYKLPATKYFSMEFPETIRCECARAHVHLQWPVRAQAPACVGPRDATSSPVARSLPRVR